jgi:hypothetical protein
VRPHKGPHALALLIALAGTLHPVVEDNNRYCGVIFRSSDGGGSWTAIQKTDLGVPFFGLPALTFASGSSVPQAGSRWGCTQAYTRPPTAG